VPLAQLVDLLLDGNHLERTKLLRGLKLLHVQRAQAGVNETS
jgi:hypothetical protein